MLQKRDVPVLFIPRSEFQNLVESRRLELILSDTPDKYIIISF